MRRQWLAIGAFYAVLAGALLGFRERFDWDHELADIPALWLAGGMVAAGLVFLLSLSVIERSANLDQVAQRRLLILIVGMGAALRALMLWSVPALEDDFHRYLWDGAMVANGFNPFGIAPSAATTAAAPERVRELAEQAGYVFERINHADLRTVYPSVAQAFFALAYLAEPWSLLAWRMIALTAEGISLCLLLAMLRDVGRSPVWVAIYWLNPLIIKELVNSAHMEAILVPLVLGAVLLAMRRRLIAAAGVLALAVATKVWPLLFAPLILRPLLGEPRRLVLAFGLFSVVAIVLAMPVVIAGLDRSSGFTAYSAGWQRNGALVPGLSAAIVFMTGLAADTSGLFVRGLVVVAAAVIAVTVAVRPTETAAELAGRVAVLSAAVLLLSPAQYPWYLAWVMPFMVLRPVKGLLAATALMPVYYASFHFRALGLERVYDTWVVWLIWVPVWALLFLEWRRAPTVSP